MTVQTRSLNMPCTVKPSRAQRTTDSLLTTQHVHSELNKNNTHPVLFPYSVSFRALISTRRYRLTDCGTFLHSRGSGVRGNLENVRVKTPPPAAPPSLDF